MKNEEAIEQQTLFQWAALASTNRPELKLLHHIPNGGKRNIVTAVKLKREGVKAGVPDIFLPVPRGSKHGLYIEMKAEKGRLSENQKWWLKELKKQGYETAVCFGWEEAKETIERYLDEVS